MCQQQPLRVLIMGQQNAFDRILAANIHCWGHEAVELPLDGGWSGREYGDVLLYDIDEPIRSATVAGKDAPALPLSLVPDRRKGWKEHWPRVRFTIILSSHSVSRDTLDELDAVAVLMKPFDVERLQRYLTTLQRLLHEGSRPRAVAESGRMRVLIVDDDEDIARAIRLCLQGESDYDIAIAHNGLEALERYVEWQPHCMVTDVIMPWMSGYQVIHCLDRSPLRMMPAFVVMSALTQFEVPVKRPYLKDKVVVHVEKPFHVERLLAAIELALHRVTAETGPLA